MNRKVFPGPSLAAAIARRIVATLAVCLVAAVACSGEPDSGGGVAREEGGRPNILFVLTDDADRSLFYEMPEIEEGLIREGTTFPNTFAPFATCCPSRSTILRGQYPHNHRVLSNYPPYGGVTKYEEVGNDRDNLATRLDAAGYTTGLFGKYLNGYEGGYVPPGWDVWHGASGNYGAMETYSSVEGFEGHDFRTRHETDVYGGRADRFIRESGSAPGGAPWFAFVAFHTPHIPTYVEDGHADEYADETSPKGPAFDEADVSDKPRYVRGLPRVGDRLRRRYDREHRDRLRAMRSVDDRVAALLRTLSETGQLRNTYVVLWNDNGYHMGQHRLTPGKRTIYEEDVRYPMVVRGPGVARGRIDERLVSGTDLMPTFLDLAGAPVPGYVDGRSVRPLLSGSDGPWRDSLLLEGYDDGFGEKGYAPPDFAAIRIDDGRTYAEYEGGEREFYDLTTDPHQLRSLHDEPERAAEAAALSARLADLQDCSGAGCRAAENR